LLIKMKRRESIDFDSFREETICGAKVAIYNHEINVLQVMESIAQTEADQKNDDPFTVINLTHLYDRYHEWCNQLPRVKPFYAVKCNSDPVMLQVLADLGCNFDCASKAEIDEVLGQGIVNDPDRIIYANTIKQRSFIEHASKLGIRKMTFDNVEELEKIKELHLNPQMVLRIRVDDLTAGMPLGVKFGCDPPMERGPELLKAGKEMGIDIVGIAFHVGSYCLDPSPFRRGIAMARELFDIGNKLGHNMYILDIGGGYVGRDSDAMTFGKAVATINPALDEYFPPGKDLNLQIEAEPGRFFGSEPVSVVAHVIGATRVPASRITKQKEDEDKDGYFIYLNDGVYGSFNAGVFDYYHPKGTPLPLASSKTEDDTKLYPTMIWGPTCSGTDQVEASTTMPKLGVGDWIYYSHMGAYTATCASHFNGFTPPEPYYVMSSRVWDALYKDKCNGKNN